jgi:type I restriction enzyme S subunit
MSSDQLGGSEILENFGISSIPSDWSVVRIEDILERERGISVGVMYPGAHHQGGVALLKVVDVRNNWISDAPDFKISPDKHQEYRRTELEGGELLITLVGQNSCQTAIVPESMKGWNAARAIAVTRIDPLKGSNHFIKYALQAPALQLLMKNWSNTTVQETLNLKEIRRIPMPMPPITEQKAIAHILGTLDDKIELNRKTNETLEAVAKALFKSWFVDFDPVRAKSEGRPTGLPAEISDLFPDSFEDSELGEIPKGWQCCPFTQLVDVISGGTPKTSIDEYWNGSIPWFSVVDAPPGSDCWVIQTEKNITHLGLNNCSSRLLAIGTTIISARGTVGKVCLAGQDMAMNQSCYGLKSKAESGEYFCFYLTKSLVEILEVRAHGSVFSTITRDTLDGVVTVSPPLEMIQVFNGVTGAFLGKIKNNLEENQILANQRDTLLPKLISGAIRVPDAEELLASVV